MTEAFRNSLEPQRQTWADAVGLLTDNGLPTPPPLPIWPAEVERFDESSFGNWVPKHALYELMDVLQDAWEDAPDGAVVAGIDGHGVRTWGFHLIVRTGPLLVGIQTEIGNVYTPVETASEALEGAWELLADLVQTARQIPASAKTLIICDADFAGHRWGWAEDNDWDRIEWHEEQPALFCGHMNLRELVSTAGP